MALCSILDVEPKPPIEPCTGEMGDARPGRSAEAAAGGGAAGAAQRAFFHGFRLVRAAVPVRCGARGAAGRTAEPRRRVPAHLGGQLSGERLYQH